MPFGIGLGPVAARSLTTSLSGAFAFVTKIADHGVRPRSRANGFRGITSRSWHADRGPYPQDFGGGGRLAAALKDARGPVQQRRLPLMDHRRMDLMSGRQFRTLRSPFSASDATRALKAASSFLRFDMS
jgi:hypothetical protein